MRNRGIKTDAVNARNMGEIRKTNANNYSRLQNLG